MKYGTLTLGQVEAAINKLGGQEAWDAWLRGEKTVTVKDAIQSLFDKHARRIPESLQANVCDPNRNFRLGQPKLDEEVDFADRITRLHGCLGVDTAITAQQFKAEAERLLAMIRDNPQIANIAKGVWLPVVLPQLTTDDLGTALEQYLEAVGKSYADVFPEREFCNELAGMLDGAVSVIESSRYGELIERMKREPVMGIYFPNPLQGYSINASREQMTSLPEGFILSGLDAVIAMVMYPDVLARDQNMPGLDLAALSWRSAEDSLGFKARDVSLFFGRTDYLARAFDSFSGGLFFVG